MIELPEKLLFSFLDSPVSALMRRRWRSENKMSYVGAEPALESPIKLILFDYLLQSLINFLLSEN